MSDRPQSLMRTLFNPALIISLGVTIFGSARLAGADDLPADLSTLFQSKPVSTTGAGYTQIGARADPPSVAFKITDNSILPEMVDHHSGLAYKLLSAVYNGDAKAFVFWGTEQFKGYKPEKFQEMNSQWRQRLGGGWSVTYFGELRMGRAATTVWRVRFFNKEPDALLTLTTDKKGSVEAFVLH